MFFFALLLVTGAEQIWIGRVFFIWTSVFNLFVVSVFWAFLVDVFSREQGTRLFGFIAAGATVGAMSGSAITASLAVGLAAAAARPVVLLEVAVFACAACRASPTAAETETGAPARSSRSAAA